MKFIPFFILLAASATATAQQSIYRAVLTNPAEPAISGAAAFDVVGSVARFTISLNREDLIPTSTWLVSLQTAFPFDPGPARITVHSPGPWPNGYDGSTAFFGSLVLPANLLSAFTNGQTVLELRGTPVGDFSGPILPESAPSIASFSSQSGRYSVRFMALPPYRYTIEFASSADMNNVTVLTNVSALSQTFEAVAQDPVAGIDARFYRIRRELCCGEE